MERSVTVRWLTRVAAIVVFLAFAAACVHCIANFWQWGHNGYNGAAFSQAARNSLRFGVVGQAQYHTGLTSPPPQAIYTHHPLMLHFHLVALFSVLGDAEWVGRIVPAAYSMLDLLAIFFVVRRHGGRLMALLASAIYVVIPMNLVFANMINHEQGGIFWCLVTIHAYLAWLESQRTRFFVLAAISITMATQFDWPGYYIAFFIAEHAFVTGILRREGVLSWRPEYTWIAVFSAVVLLNFSVFFLWIRLGQGTLFGMVESFRIRAAPPEGYLSMLGKHLADLHGWIVLFLLASWVPITAVRARRLVLAPLDTIVLFFLLAQVVHSVVFRQAGTYHSYWTIWLGPATAIGGARALQWAHEAIRIASCRLLESIGGRAGTTGVVRSVPVALTAILVTALMVPQARHAMRQLGWGRDTGSAAYQDFYDDQFAEYVWARALADRYSRGEVAYLMDSSVQGRIELTYYLDSPVTWAPVAGVRSFQETGPEVVVVLVDLARLTSHSALSRLVMAHPATVWDRRFVAVEMNGQGEGIRGLVSMAEPMTWWHRWLVNPWRPRVHWVSDPDPAAVENLFDTGIRVTQEPVRGSPGGEVVSWDCPRGQVLTSIGTVIRNTRTHGRVLGALRPFCAPALEEDSFTEPWGGPWIGGWWGEKEAHTGCMTQDLPVGIVVYMANEAVVAGVALMCAPGKGGVMDLHPGRTYTTMVAGREAGTGTHLRCSRGSAIRGVRGRLGELVDALGICCVALDEAFMDNAPTPIGHTPWEWP